MSRVYNFTSPLNFFDEINIYNNNFNEPSSDINFIKSFKHEEIIEEKVRRSFFGISTIKTKKRIINVSYSKCFVKDNEEILKVERGPIEGSDGRDYYSLVDSDGYHYTVTIDQEDYSSDSVNKCKVYDSPEIEIMGFFEENKEGIFYQFINENEVSVFLKWFRDCVIKKTDLIYFESILGKTYSLTDSEIDEISKSIFTSLNK